MASSESKDDQIIIEASQQYEDTIHENIEGDTIYLEVSQQFKAEFVEQHVNLDHRKYEHMDDDDFGIDKLMPQTSQPQRSLCSISAVRSRICEAVCKGLSSRQ